MAVKIEHIVVGELRENTYFIIDEDSRKVAIVDPGGDGKEIEDFISKNNLNVEMIINTHGHIDHVEANGFIKNKYNIPILIHPEDAKAFNIEHDKTINDGDQIDFAGHKLKVIHTPGHTLGSVCIQGDDFLLTGDTIFAGGSIGRTDLGGDMDIMMQTLAFKFEEFPDRTVLYPGHGPKTDLGYERRLNYYIQMAHDMR